MLATRIIVITLYSLLSTFSLLLFVMAICSWFPQARMSKFYVTMDRIVEPILRPIRSLLNRSNMIRNSRFDFSFLVLVLLISFVENLLLRLL